MNNAIQNAINKLKADCPSCAGPDGAKIANALQNATFVYKRSLWSPDGQTEECANARPINSKIIHVSSKAFGPKCCRLDSTLAHEATHKVTQSQSEWGPNGPMDVEDKCLVATEALQDAGWVCTRACAGPATDDSQVHLIAAKFAGHN